MKSILALAFLAACSCGPLPHPGYADHVAYVEYESSVRITITCLTDVGEVQGYGSGVAIDSRHVLTADHVAEACERAGLLAWRLEAETQDGSRVDMVFDEADQDRDAARLVVDGPGEPFHVWAEVRAELPAVGEDLCVVAGTQEGIRSMRKCGSYAGILRPGGVGGWWPVASLHVVPGNSGGAVFDSRGRVVGLVSRGSWDPREEFLLKFTPASLWWPALKPDRAAWGLMEE